MFLGVFLGERGAVVVLSWFYFQRYILSKRSGSLAKIIAGLSVLGVGLGVCCFVFTLSVMNGFNDNIRERILSTEPHLTVNFLAASKTRTIKKSDLYKKIKTLPLRSSQVFVEQDVILRTIDGIYNGAVAKGLDRSSLFQMLNRLQLYKKKQQGDEALWKENGGHLSRSKSAGITVGVNLAHRLGILEGDTLTVIPPEVLLLPQGEVPYLEEVVVNKILTTDVPAIDDKFIFYSLGQSLKTLQSYSGRQLGVEVWLKETATQKLEEYKKDIEQPGVVVESWKDRNKTLFFALKLEKIVIGLFLALSGIIAICSVITLIVLLVSQKKKEIGAMMAFGMSPKMVTQIFSHIGFYLSFLGISGGLFLSLVLMWFVKTYPLDILPGIYYDSHIPVRIDLELIAMALVVCVILAFMSGWLPAKKLSVFNPSQAIRNDKY